MTGESRPGERSSDAGGVPAEAPCFPDGAGTAAAGGRGSDGAEASGVKNPTWRILGSTPPDEERGGRRRSMTADSEGLGWGLGWDARRERRASESQCRPPTCREGRGGERGRVDRAWEAGPSGRAGLGASDHQRVRMEIALAGGLEAWWSSCNMNFCNVSTMTLYYFTYDM